MEEPAEPAARFIRRGDGRRADTDRAEISADALARSREARLSHLVRAGRRLSAEIGELLGMIESRADAARAAHLGELRRRVRDGSYDFDGIEALRGAAHALAGNDLTVKKS